MCNEFSSKVKRLNWEATLVLDKCNANRIRLSGYLSALFGR